MGGGGGGGASGGAAGGGSAGSRRPASSPCLRSQSSSRSRTIGIRLKFQGGGGEEMDHSSVRPSPGSAPAGPAERVVLTTFTRKTTKDRAMRNAPIVEARFQKVQPRSGAYV